MDWTYIRAFLAVAQAGSLSGAARSLSLSQPTLSRHVKAAEAACGGELFSRKASGLQLTDFGRMMLGPAQEMYEASARFQTLAAGQDMRVSGTVRITASMVVSHYLLPPIFSKLREAEPEIEIELVASDSTQNLIFREADIAVRMFRPTQLDVVARKIADSAMALYASHDLIARFGQPNSLEALERFPFVGFDASDLIIRYLRSIGLDVGKDFFAVRCDDQAAFWKLVCSGCGVAAMQTVIGDAEPDVQRLDFQPAIPPLPIWLAAHDAMHKTPRIKRVWDFLANGLGEQGQRSR